MRGGRVLRDTAAMPDAPSSPSPRGRLSPDLVVILCGVTAALHIGKLPPAIPVLREALGVSLLQAGFLLSLVQVAGMALGLALGLAAAHLGLRRSMLIGLAVLGLASLAGAGASTPEELLWLRVAEGCGLLLTVLPGPGLVRRLVAPQRLSIVMGIWGAYMPVGMALAMVSGPWLMAAAGWPAWWAALGALTLAMAAWLALAVPADPPPPAETGGRLELVRLTLAAPGPWLVALCFAVYAFQWLAVIGFLPAIYAQAGYGGQLAGALTAFATLVNTVGNVAAGALLHRGAAPQRLLYAGFGAMIVGAIGLYGLPGAPAELRYGAVLLFTTLGGLVPGSLFYLAVRVAPQERAVPTTVGWMQQLTSCGLFAGPPLAAWAAERAGGWQWTWAITGAAALAGMLLAARLGALLRR